MPIIKWPNRLIVIITNRLIVIITLGPSAWYSAYRGMHFIGRWRSNRFLGCQRASTSSDNVFVPSQGK